MSLQNSLNIGQLDEHTTDAAQVGKMLDSARRSIADARENSIGPDTRFDAAYRAITQLAMVALWANGYRPSRSAPGHHMTMIQSLCQTVGLDNDQMMLLEKVRTPKTFRS